MISASTRRRNSLKTSASVWRVRSPRWGRSILTMRKNWDLRLTDAERLTGERALDPFDGGPLIAVNMGGKVLQNHWGQDNWRGLSTRFRSHMAATGCLFLGAADEAGTVGGSRRGWPGIVVNACGELLPRESAGALRRASLFIGHDSGPMHLAAALGITCSRPLAIITARANGIPMARPTGSFIAWTGS